MIVKNYFGTALDFLPKEVMSRGLSTHIDSYTDMVSYNNTIYLMTGTMPETNELYEINDITEFEDTYGDVIITKLDGIDLKYHYDKQKKERIIKKNWKDALDFTYNVDGTITWFAVKLTEIEGQFIKAESITYTNLNPTYNEKALRLDDIPYDNYSFNTDVKIAGENQKNVDLFYTFEQPELLTEFIIRRSSYYLDTFTVYVSNDNTTWKEVAYKYIGAGGSSETYTIKLNNLTDTTKYKYAKVSLIPSNGYVILQYAIFKAQKDTDHSLIFSDSVGVWEDTDRVIITETLSGNQGAPNIFKDFTLAMRDTCNLEIAAEPTVEYTDNDAGIIVIDAISDNVITNPERLQDLIINGTTIGIENGQQIEAYLNGIRYTTNVVDSVWSITIPATDTANLEYDTTYNVKVDCRDRAGNLGTSNRDVYVKALNIAPTITVDSTLTVLEDSSTEIAVSFTDIDGSIASKTVSAINGVTTYNEDTGIITYVPNANFNGSDTITISVVDDLNAETITTIAVNVSSVNDIAMLAVAESVSTDEDTSITIPYTVSDLDGTIVSVVATAGNGSIVVDKTENTIVYTPNLNFNGGDTIVVTATDNEGLEIVKNISVVVNSINDTPVIAINDVTTTEDTSINIPYTASDIEGGVVITVSGTNGTAVVDLANDQIIFTPDTNYVGFASFDVTVTDSEDAFITKTVNVEVTAVNDNPLLIIDTVHTMNENTSKVITYSVTDIDGSIDSITCSETPNGSTVVDMAAQTITYTPNNEFIGDDTFTVTATDNEGGTDSKIITITVENVDIPAVITVDSTITTTEETEVVIPYSISDFDGITTETGNALNGSVSISNGNISYLPNTNFVGDDTITLTSTDELGGVTATDIVVTVTNINDAPIVTLISNITVAPDSVTDISYEATDIDNDNLTITISNSGDGSVSLNTSIKTISYDAPSVASSDTITLTVNDGTVDTIKTIDITVEV